MRKLKAAIIIHPGDILNDELGARNIKQKDFAKLIGILPTQLNEILKGKRNLNIQTIVLISAALNMDLDIWINLQVSYELEVIERDRKIQKRILLINKNKAKL